MARINLLPWREQLREEHKKQFLIILAIVVVVALVMVVVADRFLNMTIDGQQGRNDYIRAEEGKLDDRIKEIAGLRKESQQLIERTKVIQDLQADRQVTGRVFDQLVRTLPEDVYYKSVKVSDGVIRLDGIASANPMVSELMRRLSASPWMKDPNLTQVVANPDGAGVKFSLTVNQARPSLAEMKEEVQP